MTHADWIKALVSGLTTAAGIVLGLVGNAYVTRAKDKQACQSMLLSIISEAESNQIVLRDSFLHYFREGIVFRSFTTVAAERCLADPLFTRHTPPLVLQKLYEYIRTLTLANAYRSNAEKVILQSGRDAVEAKYPAIYVAWELNLTECGQVIEETIRMGPPGMQDQKPRQSGSGF